MLTLAEPITLTGGFVAYRDDMDPGLLYALPSALALKERVDRTLEFCLLFYQSDDPERGARFVASFVPEFGAPNEQTTRLQGIPVRAGEALVRWPGFETRAIASTFDTSGRVELGFSRAEAIVLRRLLKEDGENIQVRMCFEYDVCRTPVAARVRLDTRAICASLAALTSTPFSGERLRQMLADLPSTAFQLEANAEGTLNSDTLRILAPRLAALITTTVAPHPIFERALLRLLDPSEVSAGEFMLDLQRVRTWQQTWEGDWSLSDFYRTLGPNVRPSYFPEVLALAPVGTVDLLIENLLPIDGRTLERVTTNVRYRKLGSLEEQVFTADFRAQSSPVARCSIPHIALTPFSYRHRTELRTADPSIRLPGLGELQPESAWIEASAPILRIGTEGRPFVFAHVSAHTQVFEQVSRIDLEIAAEEGGEPLVVAQTQLAAAEPWHWLALEARLFERQRLRWRAHVHPSAGDEAAVQLAWQLESNLTALITLAHIYPRTPLRVRASIELSELDDVDTVRLEVLAGRVTLDSRAELTQTFDRDTSQSELVVWPHTIFERGVSFRYAIVGAGFELEWTTWRYQTEEELVMRVADDFYNTQLVQVSVRAPWSQRDSPDPTNHAAELIFVEVHLTQEGQPSSAETQLTFDRTQTAGPRTWRVQSRKSASSSATLRYSVTALSADGRWLALGSGELTSDRLELEVYVQSSSSEGLPEFGLR